MSSNFDSSILENIPQGTKTAEENIYYNSEETFGGEYCDLDHIGDPERTRPRHKKVSLQNDVRHNGRGAPATSTNRGRTRLVSDSQLVTQISRFPEEQNRARIRNQPSITSEGSRRIPEVRPSSYSYLNRGISVDLPGNSQNMIISEQPKPRGMVLRQEERDNSFASYDSRENIPRNPRPKPRTVPNDESKTVLENRQDITRNRMLGDPRARNTHADRLDFNMNRARPEARQANGEIEYGRERNARPIMHKQSSTEKRSDNYNGQREDLRIEKRGEKRPILSSDVNSRPHRHLGIMERATNESTRENKTRRNDEIEMANMAKTCSPRIQQLRQEGTQLKNPLLGLAFPRPHSFDVPENKTQVWRTFSSPELTGSSLEEFFGDKNESIGNEGSKDFRHQSNGEHYNRPNHQPSNNSSKAVVKIKGKRSKSLPVPGNAKISSSTGRRGQPAEASPLRYFAYLGKRFPFRERLLSAHVLSARPVILTSTSVISPEVTTNFCQQLEDSDPCDDTDKRPGACQDLIDCCTCMCCVKALFYHCTKDDESEGNYAEHPCSCSGPDGNCLCRWSVLGVLSLFMPCILCYLPVQGCTLGVEYCRRKPSTPDCNE